MAAPVQPTDVPKYISQLDLENVLSPQTIRAVFCDDPSTGVVNVAAITEVILLAEGEVDSYLVGVRDVAQLVKDDRLLKTAALDFAKCFAFERDPAYVRTFGEDPRGYQLYKRAQARMERIRAAAQELPDQQGARPKNVGAIIRGAGPRMMIDSADGTVNNSGF